jgi:4a-hydroxytetrahydrobiopterin dehydratase
MSERGWRDFLAASDLVDWSVLHGGAIAFFRTPSIAAAARLAEAISSISEIAGRGVSLNLSDAGLSVRLTRDLWRLEAIHAALARQISEVAAAHGAQADGRPLQEIQIAIAAKAEMIDVGFWRAVLGYDAAADDNAIDPLGHGSTIWMQEIDQSKPLRHAMHIDVSVPREHMEERLASALAAGGRIVDGTHAPAHWTLSDKAGNRVCLCAWPDGSTETVK